MNMKYMIGDVFYKESNNRLVKVEIKDVVYIIGNGTINGKKYITDKDIEKAFDNKEIHTSEDFYIQKQVAEKKHLIEILENEIKELEKK